MLYVVVISNLISSQPAQSHLIDATRLSDGKLVMIKKVARDSQEVRIATYLSSEALQKDPRNHTVPVFDILDDPDDPTLSFMVMVYLRRIHDVEFDTVGSIFDCVGQLLEVSATANIVRCLMFTVFYRVWFSFTRIT